MALIRTSKGSTQIKDVLYTNADPTSSMTDGTALLASTTVLDSYNSIEIEYHMTTASTTEAETFAVSTSIDDLKKTGFFVSLGARISGTDYTRKVFINNSDLEVTHTYALGTGTVANSNLIPIKVYGIK